MTWVALFLVMFGVVVGMFAMAAASAAARDTAYWEGFEAGTREERDAWVRSS